MSMQGYPEPYAQYSSGFSQSQPALGVGAAEAQRHTGPTQYNPQVYSAGPYKGHVGAGASGESRLEWWIGDGADDEQ